MTIEKLDHIDQGINRLTSVFSESEKLKIFLTAFLRQMEEVEESLIQLSKQKDLDTVTGVWLDYIGYIVGQPRAGQDDEEYRQSLQLKIAINKSDGTPPVVHDIVKTYTESDRVRIAEGILSFGQIIFDGEKNADKTLWGIVQDIKPVTTNVVIVQDTENKSFFPAWEEGTIGLELFNAVVSTGVSETLELVLGASSTGSLFLNLQGEQVQYDPDTIGREIIEWEDPEEFTLFDGTSDVVLELQIDASTVEPLVVEGIEAAVLNETLLPWEINEFSFINPLGAIEDYEWFDGNEVNPLFVNLNSTDIEKLQVSGVAVNE